MLLNAWHVARLQIPFLTPLMPPIQAFHQVFDFWQVSEVTRALCQCQGRAVSRDQYMSAIWVSGGRYFSARVWEGVGSGGLSTMTPWVNHYKHGAQCSHFSRWMARPKKYSLCTHLSSMTATSTSSWRLLSGDSTGLGATGGGCFFPGGEMR